MHEIEEHIYIYIFCFSGPGSRGAGCLWRRLLCKGPFSDDLKKKIMVA